MGQVKEKLGINNHPYEWNYDAISDKEHKEVHEKEEKLFYENARKSIDVNAKKA